MNIKKLAASLMMLSLCTVGVENVSAAAAGPLRIAEGIHLGGDDRMTPLNNHDNSPVLVAGSPEELLFKALYRKHINVLEQQDVSAGGVKGLSKYLNRLIRVGITADVVNDPSESPPKIRATIHTRMGGVSKFYHDDSTAKAGRVRDVVTNASVCIRTIAQVTRDIALAGNTDAIITAFEDALGPSNEELARIISENFAGGMGAEHADGASGRVLEDNRQAILELQRAISALVRFAMLTINNLVDSGTTMRLFHEIYIILCRAHCGGREFFEGYVDPVDGIRKSAYNDFDPPSAENGNKTLYERYQEWLRITGFPEPQNGIG